MVYESIDIQALKQMLKTAHLEIKKCRALLVKAKRSGGAYEPQYSRQLNSVRLLEAELKYLLREVKGGMRRNIEMSIYSLVQQSKKLKVKIYNTFY